MPKRSRPLRPLRPLGSEPLASASDLRRELLALAAEDQRVRAELVAEGTLFDGYHPRMEAVHRRNAAYLAAVIDRHGWPGAGLIGADGADAAWLIAQHAVSEPEFQRRCLAAEESRSVRARLRSVAATGGMARIEERRP
jgi:hypothetical protein